MSELRFDGRVAIVTGAGRGIGRAEARALASRGARVVVNDLGSTPSGEGSTVGPANEVAAEIRATGGEAVASVASVATTEGAEAIVGAALDAFGQVDIVVNNAGILLAREFHELTLADLERQLAVHVGGAFNVTKAAWPHLVGQGHGRVVMTTSSAGLYGLPVQSAYGAAKGGVLGLTRCLAIVGRSHGIRVNAIAPGAFTRMHAGLTDERFKSFTEQTRTADQVAPTVLALAHDACPVSGETFSLSGGRVARVFIAETPGFFDPDHTPEDVLAHWDAVMAEPGYVIPEDAAASIELTYAHFRSRGIEVPEIHSSDFRRPS